jgi:hypothetical protein
MKKYTSKILAQFALGIIIAIILFATNACKKDDSNILNTNSNDSISIEYKYFMPVLDSAFITWTIHYKNYPISQPYDTAMVYTTFKSIKFNVPNSRGYYYSCSINHWQSDTIMLQILINDTLRAEGIGQGEAYLNYKY